MAGERVGLGARARGDPRRSCAATRDREAGQPVPRLGLTIDETAAGITGEELRRRLWKADRRILVLPHGTNAFFMTPDTLSEPEAATISSWIRATLGRMGKDVSSVGPDLDP